MTFNTHSLSRAVDCLNRCILCCSCDGNKSDNGGKKVYLESARVLLAYVWMELNNPSQVIHVAEVMLNEKPLPSHNGESYCVKSLRRRATMQMYASEAYRMSGIPSDAMRYLNLFVSEQCGGGGSGSGSGSDFEDLTAHLAAVDVKVKDNDQLAPSAMKRLRHARASIKISTAMTNLSLGDVQKARVESQSVFDSLSNGAGMNDLKSAATSSLIQSLICEGRVSEAVQIAKNLK